MSNRLQLIDNARMWTVTGQPDAYEHYNAIITRWFYRLMAAAMAAGLAEVAYGTAKIQHWI